LTPKAAKWSDFQPELIMHDKSSRRYLFLDRDGTLIVEKHYLCDPEQIELCENAIEGLKRFKSMGFRMIVVTNQSGIGRGYYDVSEMDAVHCRIQDLLKNHLLDIEEFLFCPHKPEDRCACRKPALGLLDERTDFDREIRENSVMIGDKDCDIEFGLRAGMLAILVKTGYGSVYSFKKDTTPHFVAKDLLDAAEWVHKNCHE
jgi:D-glycero-D-manno-heptose 1,7-bisphosphate phosphatase